MSVQTETVDIGGMPGYVGVDPDALLGLAELLDDAALEMRGCAALVGQDGDDGTLRLHVVGVAEWAEHEASSIRQRATTAHTYDLVRGPHSP